MAGVKTISKHTIASENGSRIGRPSREESQRRHRELLERAFDIFLQGGYEATTTAEIAAAVGMSKRTMYTRYADKAELFKATVHRAIEKYTLPYSTLVALETDDLEETLRAVARLRITNISQPTNIGLQRILNSQSYRFPELFEAAFEEGAGPTVKFLIDLFSRYNERGDTSISDPRRAASAFLSLVVGGPARTLTAGGTLSDEQIEEQVEFSVRLFLDGVRSR